MARIHSHRRGKSQSVRPTSKRTPSWVTYSSDEIEALIVKMAKDGLTSSEIGMRLRDEHAIPWVEPILGKSIYSVLKEHKYKLQMPEDLDRIMKRAKKLQAHLSAHRSDHKNVRSLELLEAKVHRLSRYYKRIGELQADWKYSATIAQLA